MSQSGEDDLPDLDIGNFSYSEPKNITRINVDAEIAEDLARKVRRQLISEQKSEYQEEIQTLPDIKPIPEQQIQSFPPDRPIFNSERSLRSFNCDSLNLENTVTSEYTACSSDNVEEFFSWIRSKIKNSDDTIRKRLFQYVWLLISCHPDSYVVNRGRDLLVEYTTIWQLEYEEVILVLYNWGVCPSDFVTDIPLHDIDSNLDPRPIVSASNVQNVLEVLLSQLMVKDLDGCNLCRKPIFLSLTLLTLDKNYYECLASVIPCLDEITKYAKCNDPCWVQDYSEGLFQVDFHYAHLAYLVECVVPQSMRWCLCLAFCQSSFSLMQSFQANPEPEILLEILEENIDEFLKLESWKLYCTLSIVDAGISNVVSVETNQDIKKGFLDWLNQYMERRIERRTDDVDVDASLIAELVSRLQAGWESSWLEEPGMQNLELNYADEGVMEIGGSC